ncbi:RhoGAP domain containing protein [Acanthamoeba castellanii str. Neff]|uniref:RhoGAP domain containing protein n=1 Tax=Acanthamoeba castellanii (strain ATCC 30010 / Neff) TaxID=1257118 RepID=L8GMX2_ACACF|nr:RhoGAP domain containing protein [Acanthamoeba castellanii str. Neff]ELR14088.1 RhoGAP domain containing protein [Acanthamoeba castellanii str. Neff]
MLKLYFRELPEPLCTYKGYQLFCDSQREPDAEQGKVMLMAALAALPPVNRALFATVTRLLKDVAAHEKLNFMSPDNLGIVWGPTLLREEKENFMSMDLPVSVIISLIKYCDEIFVGEEKLELKAASQAIILHTAPSHTAAEMSDSSGSLSVSSMPRSPATPDMLGSGTQEIHHPHPLPQPPPFPRLPSDFGVGIRSPDSGGADSDRTGVRPGFVPGTVILVLYRPWALDHSHSPEATRPVPPVARRTSDIEGTPTPLRVGIGMSTPPRRALGSRREYSENDLP